MAEEEGSDEEAEGAVLVHADSARSQLAEGFLRYHAGDRFEAYRAECSPSDEVHPYVMRVMDEVGIDVSDQHPKGLRAYMGKIGFD